MRIAASYPRNAPLVWGTVGNDGRTSDRTGSSAERSAGQQSSPDARTAISMHHMPGKTHLAFDNRAGSKPPIFDSRRIGERSFAGSIVILRLREPDLGAQQIGRRGRHIENGA